MACVCVRIRVRVRVRVRVRAVMESNLRPLLLSSLPLEGLCLSMW